jgi:hypothetical protein
MFVRLPYLEFPQVLFVIDDPTSQTSRRRSDNKQAEVEGTPEREREHELGTEF